jgi:hypothetical protein
MNKAIVLERECAETYGCRAAALNDLGRFDEAAIDGATALTINPAQVDALSNLGVSRQQTGNINDALTCYLRAIRINDNVIEAHNNAGALMLELCRPEAAIHHFERVLSLASEHVDANVSKAMAMLMLGDFVLGFKLYEWRLRKLWLPSMRTSQLRWTGYEPVRAQTLLLLAEQGLGDTLQFCRYGRLAAEAGARVVLVLPRGLTRLFSAQRWVSQVIESDEPLPTAELHCPMMSLPLAFGTTLETIPYGKEAYLQALPEDVQRWGHWLDERLGVGANSSRRLRVGVVWNGGFRADQPELWAVNERRNVPLELFARALDIAGIDFVSLQKGDPAESQLRRREGELWRAGRLVNAAAELNDFADTAGLIMNLDVVISVDTSTAHLAGALGKPTWILNRYDTCWRWLLEREDSPWYGSVKLYRQAADRDWKPILDKVAGDLRVRATHRPASSIDLA